MKNLLKLTLLLSCLAAMPSCNDDEPEPANSPAEKPEAKPKWNLEWSDDFDSETLDETVWSRIPAGSPDWQVYQSTDDRCYEISNSILTLKGIINDNPTADSRPYLCGGIWTSGKKAFKPGRIVIRARLTKAAQGAWPAIWMMPFAPETGWPDCGEIDIMERLNHDGFIYQTMHSKYIDTDNNKNNPQYSKTIFIDPSEWHDYEVYVFMDRVVFRIDNKITFEYPRYNNGAGGQYPFYTDWDLRIDMQLGGSWVGAISASQLPAEMEIDWVKYYLWH